MNAFKVLTTRTDLTDLYEGHPIIITIISKFLFISCPKLLITVPFRPYHWNVVVENPRPYVISGIWLGKTRNKNYEM